VVAVVELKTGMWHEEVSSPGQSRQLGQRSRP
jgi:hypothetical protein